MQEYVNSLIEKERALKMEEEFLLDLFISYKISYDYYGISDDNFKKIFDKAVKMALNKDNFEIRIANILNGMAVKYFLDNYRKDTRLLNNFLIKLKKNNNSNFKILRALGKEFEAKELTLDEELIKMLRQNAPCFQKIIKASGIDDLSNRDLIFVILGKYDNYISLKPLNHSLKWTIITLREVALIINYPLGNLSKDIMKNEVIIDKLRFILAFYDNIYLIIV